ncbi:MAG: glycosyltransferase family 2 protein [Myxococcales bacterium]|nr:glycosyltransferase family 2 protein [Myxococcales bacterium]
MSDLPRISIVTPSFNQGRFIAQTLDSVLGQGYPNLEYIVVDGGSTDGTIEILDRYRDRLSVCISEPDEGQSDALIKGFSRATGEIRGWLCSDDLLLPGALARVAESCPPEGWLIGSARVIDADGRTTGTVAHDRYRRGDILFNSYILTQVSVFWSAALQQRVRGIERSLHYCMDFDLWTQFERECAPRVIDDVLAAFRVHEDAKTAATGATWDEIFRRRAELLEGRLVERITARLGYLARAQLARVGLGRGVGLHHIEPGAG